MSRTIEIMVTPDGAVSIDAVGFKGADCEQTTKFLEQALGLVSGKRYKAEYQQTVQRRNQQRLGS
jgi:hypothetical protein